MKQIKNILTLLLIAGGSVMAQEKSFTINGTMKHKPSGTIYFQYGKGVDSTRIVNGKFSFQGQLKGPASAMLMMDKNDRGFVNYAQLYIVPARMTLNIDYDDFRNSATMTGSPIHAEYEMLQKQQAPVMKALAPFSKAYDVANEVYIKARREKKDEHTLDSLKMMAEAARDKLGTFQEQLSKMDRDFMNTHPASFVTASMMRYMISDMSFSEAQERYEKLGEDVKESSLGHEIKSEVDALRKGSPGAKAFAFSSAELRGGELSLSDFKGKYVLLDFWASWCVPCRAGNPHLLALYAKYKDKGFEIIGISDDDNNPDAWKKAVEKDGIGVWKHVLRGLKYDGKDFDRTNDISDQYGIHTLPTKILINPQGIVIGRYGGGGENDEAMDARLAEIFK